MSSYIESKGKFYKPIEGVTFNVQQVGPTRFVFINSTDPKRPGQAYENPEIEEIVGDGWFVECEAPDTHERRVEKALRDLVEALGDLDVFSGRIRLRAAFTRAKEVLSE